MIGKIFNRFLTYLREKEFGLTPVQNRPTRIQVAVWAIILLALIAVSINGFQKDQIGFNQDDAEYIILARSLVYSNHYGMINSPGQPEVGKYPFGYPLYLAAVLLLFPNDLDAIKFASLFATVLNIILLFWGWRWFFPGKSYWWSVSVTALYAFSPLIIIQSHQAMAEPIFLTFCLLAILLSIQYVHGIRPFWWEAALGASFVMVTFTRANGFVLVAVIFLYMLLILRRTAWKKIFETLFFMALFTSAVVLLTSVSIQDLIPTSYLSKDVNARFLFSLFKIDLNPAAPQNQPDKTIEVQNNQGTISVPVEKIQKESTLKALFFFDIRQHFGKDLRAIVLPFGGGSREVEFARKIGFPELPNILGYLISFLIILGFIHLLRQFPTSLFLWFAIFYFGLLMFWYWVYPRLLYPIQPQLLLAFLASLEGIVLLTTSLLRKGRQAHSIPSFVTASLFILLALAMLFKSANNEDYRLRTGDFQIRTSWLAAHSNAKDIIMTELPKTDYVYSLRKTVPYPRAATSDQLAAYLHTMNIRYILLAPYNQWYDSFKYQFSKDANRTAPLLDQLAKQNKLQLVYESTRDHIRVYEMQP